MKKLLILGGTAASVEVLKVAKSLGYYVVVADDAPTETRIAKQMADEAVEISTTDYDKLKKYISANSIDGVFCGPSEFNIVNVMEICRRAELLFYCTKEQWDICSNKYLFKKLCRKFEVPCVEEYDVETDSSRIRYPVIVKPVDGCSSKGLTVCEKAEELEEAYHEALQYSESKKVVVEKYIQNQGLGVSVRYIIENGNYHLSLMGDRYVTDPYNKTALTTNVVIYPSKYTEYYIDTINKNVQDMFRSIGICNGVLFMQALPEEGELYFHEMGLRLSGGLPYVITEAANGINDVKMMIRYAVGEEMCTEQEKLRIDPYLNGKCAVLFSIPVKSGVIHQIDGIEEIKEQISLIDYTQYYFQGDYIPEDYIGTTMQFFCRFKFFASDREEAAEKIDQIQKTIRIRDHNEKDMIYQYFDSNRIK